MRFILYILLTITVSFLNAKRPHIIFMYVDDLGWNDVSFHGSLQIPTPNIDVLAANGVVLNNYYLQPLCSPSRAAVLSGKHPIHLGLQHYVLLGSHRSGLPLDTKIFPEYFKKLGYSTKGIGKWHLGMSKKEFLPTNRGFDSFFGYWNGLIDYYDHTALESGNGFAFEGWGHALKDDMRAAKEFQGKYSTHLFTDRAVNHIENHNISEPLFLYFAPNAVHTGNKYASFQAPYEKIMEFTHIKNVERRIFAVMVSELDKSIGKIFQALDKKKMLDNTILVLSTDNGGEGAGFRGGVGSNWPLRGTKGTLWEGGVRGVGMIWSKLLKRQPRIENGLMHTTDWLPTLYYAAGGDVNDLDDIYGLNLWHTLSTGAPSPRKELLHNIDPMDGASALRYKNYKLINGSNFGGKYNGWYDPTGRNEFIHPTSYKKLLQSCDIWKSMQNRDLSQNLLSRFPFQVNVQCPQINNRSISNCDPVVSPCLFDLLVDPCEQDNIAKKESQLVQSMLKRLKEFQSTAAPLVDMTLYSDGNPALYNCTWTNWQDVSHNRVF